MLVNRDSKASFEVGNISENDKLIETKEYKEWNVRLKTANLKKSEYLKNYKPSFMLPDNLNELERMMLENDFNADNELTINKIQILPTTQLTTMKRSDQDH